MKHVTDEIIHNYQADLWKSAVERHGTAFKVPRDEQQRISELVRGLYVIQAWQARGSQGNPVRFMGEYSLSRNVIEILIPSFLGKQKLVEAEEAKPVKRADKWKALEEWAKKNTYHEVTTEQLVEISGFSYQTVLNYVKTSPYFRKIQRGQWEVRDPKEDRAREKLNG